MLHFENKSRVRVVDLFCGCGGLSLGFDLFDGQVAYETVLGVDIEPSAVRVFNDNFVVDSSSRLQRGRLADVTWFAHPSEIRLFYLSHLAEVEQDWDLKSKLEGIGLKEFLGSLRAIDEKFREEGETISKDIDYKYALQDLAQGTFLLAIVKVFLAKLGIDSFARLSPSVRSLPWVEEYSQFTDASLMRGLEVDHIEEILCSTRAHWNSLVRNLIEASLKEGKGQNVQNNQKLQLLLSFLSSEHGKKIEEAWVNWRTARDSLRAKYCLENLSKINQIYSKARVHVVLGGPPCKGFSRIGRPVIESLRNQGAHAWSHHEYGDERNALMIQYVLFLEALKPDAFLFENVSNFESSLKTPAGTFNAPDLLMELIDDLTSGGLHYHIKHKLVNARHCAVPQDRRRFIMFGVNAEKATEEVVGAFFAFKDNYDDLPLSAALQGLGSPAEFSPGGKIKSNYLSPVADFEESSLDPTTRKYVSWVRQKGFSRDFQPRQTDAHIYRRMREDDYAFLRYVAPGTRWMDLKINQSETLSELRSIFMDILEFEQGSEELRSRVAQVIDKVDDSLFLRILLEHTVQKFKLPEQHLLSEGYLSNGMSKHGDWFERLSAGKPCKTVVAHIGKDTYGYFHPYENRALTIREAARVQSFPDFFQFGSAGVVDAYTVIGNAVAPLMANRFAQRLYELNIDHNIFGEKKITVSKRQNKSDQLSLIE